MNSNINIKRSLLPLLVLVGLAFNLKAQAVQTKVIVTKTNGEEVSYNLTESDFLTFNEGQNLVVNASGSTDVIPLGTVRKVVFEKILDGVDENTAMTWISPNPANDSFRVFNIGKEEEMSIYSTTGQKVLSGTASDNQTVDISNLASGIYLVKIGSSNVKLMKR